MRRAFLTVVGGHQTVGVLQRRFMARDPEGHAWAIGQVIREVEPADWGATAT